MNDRTPRCLRLVDEGQRGINRCTAERLPGLDLCSNHLAEAYRDYLAVVDTMRKAAAA